MNASPSTCRFTQIWKAALYSIGIWIPFHLLMVRLLNLHRFSAIIKHFDLYLLVVTGAALVVSLCISVVVKFILAVPYFSSRQKKLIILVGFSYWYIPLILLRVLGGDVIGLREWMGLLFVWPLMFAPIPMLLLFFMNRSAIMPRVRRVGAVSKRINIER